MGPRLRNLHLRATTLSCPYRPGPATARCLPQAPHEIYDDRFCRDECAGELLSSLQNIYKLVVKLLSRLRGRRRARLTGVSTPLFGVSWEYGPSDCEAVGDLFLYLESRRALWIPFDSENHEYVVRSILSIREELTSVQ